MVPKRSDRKLAREAQHHQQRVGRCTRWLEQHQRNPIDLHEQDARGIAERGLAPGQIAPCRTQPEQRHRQPHDDETEEHEHDRTPENTAGIPAAMVNAPNMVTRDRMRNPADPSS